MTDSTMSNIKWKVGDKIIITKDTQSLKQIGFPVHYANLKTTIYQIRDDRIYPALPEEDNQWYLFSHHIRPARYDWEQIMHNKLDKIRGVKHAKI